ncbi:MAG: RnfH family protein [Betaproteobacteria bacterium]|jgi:hypothetical protein|nr:hypothetical protein AEM42_12970 [Betaproteobacteria bacterium UKL13-2]HCG52617.1 RnfH family protein [Betaproteobacteria bacterium]
MLNEGIVNGQIKIYVAWAEGAAVREAEILIPRGTSIGQLRDSPIFQACVPPEIRALAAGLGVWGRVRSESYPLRPRDRVEIYQPLKADPKEQRRRRAR